MKNKLNRIISIILSSIISVTLFTGCAKTESVPEETTVSETTAATISADLTEEEMAIWESMPDIVTMRVYNDCIAETTEILYITKYGEMKSFISDEYYEGYKDSEWIENKINDSKVEAISLTDVHKLIEFYNVFLLNDKNSKLRTVSSLQYGIVEEVTYYYEIYGLYNTDEVLFISRGSSSKEYIINDANGRETLKKYLDVDPFIKLVWL